MMDKEIVSKVTYWLCELIGDPCHQRDINSPEPDCDACITWKDWKASGKSIDDYWNDMNMKGGELK